MTTRLNFKKIGNSQKVLLFFHGFGQDHSLWDAYCKILSSSYTIFSFDIFYHGHSTRPANHLTKDQWQYEIGTFLKQEKIDRFNVVGFSLGGRFCLATLMGFHNQIDQMVLIAPDGIHRSFWYRLANSPLGNTLFKNLMYSPSRFEQFINVVKHTGLVRESLIKFAARELRTMDDKDKVFKTWTYFSQLQIKPSHWQALISNTNKNVLLVLGSKDSIVRPQDIQAIVKENNGIKIVVIEGKHHHVVNNAQDMVTSFLLNSFS
jgi:pimeloyl-ACP methyl ester carboxylesterase